MHTVTSVIWCVRKMHDGQLPLTDKNYRANIKDCTCRIQLDWLMRVTLECFVIVKLICKFTSDSEFHMRVTTQFSSLQ